MDLWGGGVNNNWDTNTLNWTNSSTTVAYGENDFRPVQRLGQTNPGQSPGPRRTCPDTWTFTNNVLNYKFTGTNSVGGGAGGWSKPAPRP